MPKTPPDGVLTVTGTTTVSDVVVQYQTDRPGWSGQISGAVLRSGRYVIRSLQWMVDHVDGVYTRSYDVSVAATPLSFRHFVRSQ
jgi:hypothetical protein